MRPRLGLVLCLAIVGLVTALTIEPRFHHLFPSMIDDWSGIEKAPEQLRAILRLENPEEQRYRPGFVAWSALQWHTLGAPRELVGPQVWGALRALVLVLGVVLLAFVVVGAGRRLEAARWLLLLGVPLVVLTPPSLAIDLARFGPQEPLLVGGMGLGAALLVRTFDRLLDADVAPLTVAVAVAGAASWAFGALQKEASVCVLLLAPFLWPTLRAERPRWNRLARRPRAAIGLVAAGIVLPFVPMLVRTVELTLTGERVYEEARAGRSFVTRLSDQLGRASDLLHTPLPTIVLGAAVLLLAARAFRRGMDWLSAGLLLVALAFLVLAAGSGVEASRYYLPPLVLAALALARSAVALGAAATLATGIVLVVGGSWQAYEARGWVEWWVDGEQAREAVVRQAAARAAGGCRVGVTGLNVESVAALPVLMPLADEPPAGCSPGERFVVVIDAGGAGTATPPTDPVLAACAPEPEPVWESADARILRCTGSPSAT